MVIFSYTTFLQSNGVKNTRLTFGFAFKQAKSLFEKEHLHIFLIIDNMPTRNLYKNKENKHYFNIFTKVNCHFVIRTKVHCYKLNIILFGSIIF